MSPAPPSVLVPFFAGPRVSYRSLVIPEPGGSTPVPAWVFDVTNPLYGATGNGQVVIDGAITGGQNTLTTVGLSPPSAPTVVNAGSGPIGPGTYQVVLTYVNAYGETVASSSTSTTVSGSAATITITGPALSGNATGWYAYVTQANGATFTRQQSAPTVFATPQAASLVLSANPTSTGPQPPASNTTPSNPFKLSDAGKTVIVNGALSSGNAQVFTISAYNGPGNVTLSGNATTTVSGAAVLWGSDDTPAFQSAINAAAAYMNTTGFAEVFKPAPPNGVFYMIAGPLVTTGDANSQLVIPFPAYAGSQPTMYFSAPAPSVLALWSSLSPQLNAGIVSTGVFGSTTLQQNNISTFGDASVLGATPSVSDLLGEVNSLPVFGNINVVVENWGIVTPSSTQGLNYTAINLKGAAKGVCLSCACLTTTNYNDSTVPNNFPSVSTLTAGLSFGILLPGNGNNASALARDCQISGYAFGTNLVEEVVIDRCLIVGTGYGFKIFGSDTIGNAHLMVVQATSVQKIYQMFQVSGAADPRMTLHADIDTEVLASSGSAVLNDINSGAALATLYGRITLSGNYSDAKFPPLYPVNVKMISGSNTSPGWIFGYTGFTTATSGVAVQNPYWRDARIYVSGGIVTEISAGDTIGGTGGSSTTPPAMTDTGMDVSPAVVDWPSGGWLAITYSSAPAVNVLVS